MLLHFKKQMSFTILCQANGELLREQKATGPCEGGKEGRQGERVTRRKHDDDFSSRLSNCLIMLFQFQRRRMS